MIKPVKRNIGWKKYFTCLYWNLQINSLLIRGKGFDEINIIELEIDDNSELGKLLKGSNDD